MAIAPTLLLGGCVGGFANSPMNTALTADPEKLPEPPGIASDTIIGLSFSGGGMRAAAFSFGVLQGLESVPATNDTARTALDQVGFVSAVSGGSVTAAYFGLKGPAGYDDFDQRFLYQDVEKSLRTNLFDPGNIRRLMRGGLNDRSTFGTWLDENLFDGALIGDLNGEGRPEVWINASDLYHRTPFPFTPELFQTFCSDVSKLPLSEAVSASAAVPVAFAPVVIERFPDKCSGFPAWATAALSDPAAPRTVHAAAAAARDYSSSETGHYIKLADGGLSDNFGLTSIVISRYASGTQHGPMTAEEAVRLRRMVFLVVSSEQTETGTWTSDPEGPGVFAIVKSATDTAIASTVRLGYDNFVTAMDRWRDDLIEFRCALGPEQRTALGVPDSGWRCDEVEITVEDISFESFGADERELLNAIPTALTLNQADVDRLIEAGRRSALGAKAIQALGLGSNGDVRGTSLQVAERGG